MKQAMSMGFLVAIIIVLTSFMLIAGTLMRWMAKGDDLAAEATCENSLALRAATAVAVNLGSQEDKSTEVKYGPILCQTIEKKISGDREEIKQAIADKMARCWKMFGEGRYVSSVFANTNQLGSISKCFMCYSIFVEELENEEEKEGPISELEFQDYFRDSPYPRQKDMTYLKYVQESGGPGFVATLLRPGIGIKEGGAYAIVFRAKSQDCDACLAGAVTGIGVAAGGGVTAYFTKGFVGLPQVLQGGALAYGSISNWVETYFTNRKVPIDGLVLADFQDESLQKVLQRCEFVPDIQGT